MSLTEYHYLRDGNPEVYEAAILERLLQSGMMVVDVGANHGLFSLEAAHFIGPAGRIHAFEPAPRTHDRLVANLRVNGLDHVVRVFGHALGAEPGTAQLRVHHEWTGLNTLADHDITWIGRTIHADELVAVPVMTLDAHAEAEGLDQIDFLKMDVEGFELHVLRGARRLLSTRRVRWMMLEVGDVTCVNAGVDPAAILAELSAVGYRLHSIESDGTIGAEVVAFPTRSFSANFLAIPEA